MRELGHEMPGIVYLPADELKAALGPARISAVEALKQAQSGLPVAHIGHALLGRHK